MKREQITLRLERSLYDELRELLSELNATDATRRMLGEQTLSQLGRICLAVGVNDLRRNLPSLVDSFEQFNGDEPTVRRRLLQSVAATLAREHDLEGFPGGEIPGLLATDSPKLRGPGVASAES